MPLSHFLFPSLVRGLDLAGMILLVGGLLFKTLVASPRPDPRLELILPIFLILIGACDLVLRAQIMSGRPFGEILGLLPTVLLKSHFGKVWMLRTLLLCLLGATTIIRLPGRLRQGIALTAGVGLLLTASLSGHAADSGDLSLAVLADGLHLLAVSAWTGGLLFLAAMLRRWIASSTGETIFPFAIASLKRFSALAAICVILILVTGSYQTWLQVGSFAALLQTPYGRILSVKLLLVLPLLALAALNRYRILPQLSQHSSVKPMDPAGMGAKRLLNSVTLEIGLGVGIVACVALMTQQPPARGQWASTYNEFSHGMTHLHAEKSHVSKLQPAEGAKVTILIPSEGQTFEGDEVPIKYEFVKGKSGSHLHAYVDGKLMGMFSDPKAGTLTGIQPGQHVLELRVVAEDHQTELNATDKVRFVVE